jgi:hypothetical protein
MLSEVLIDIGIAEKRIDFLSFNTNRDEYKEAVRYLEILEKQEKRLDEMIEE